MSQNKKTCSGNKHITTDIRLHHTNRYPWSSTCHAYHNFGIHP